MRSDRNVYTPVFNSTERTLIYSVLEEAAERLRRFYCFSPREWFNYCYDVRTEGEGKTGFTDVPAFAEVRQYIPALKDTSLFPPERYHICLFDRNILSTLWRETNLDFYPFMLYILTHELIHVARFCQRLHPFECDAEALRKEEEKVDRLTHEILKVDKDSTLRTVSRLYSNLSPSSAGSSTIPLRSISRAVNS